MRVKSMQGRPAAAFELRDHRGLLHRQEDYRGGWLLLVFHRHLG
jgi:peroxiredoxin